MCSTREVEEAEEEEEEDPQEGHLHPDPRDTMLLDRPPGDLQDTMPLDHHQVGLLQDIMLRDRPPVVLHLDTMLPNPNPQMGQQTKVGPATKDSNNSRGAKYNNSGFLLSNRSSSSNSKGHLQRCSSSNTTQISDPFNQQQSISDFNSNNSSSSNKIRLSASRLGTPMASLQLHQCQLLLVVVVNKARSGSRSSSNSSRFNLSLRSREFLQAMAPLQHRWLQAMMPTTTTSTATI